MNSITKYDKVDTILLKRLRINNQIKALEIQVIDENGKQLSPMKTFDALKLAREQELDLVEVGPNMQPPIAKIMDYGKYMYRKEREEKKRGKPKEQERKTVRVGFKTGIHDMDFKAKQVNEFLKEGHMVKIELTLRGREKALAHIGRQKLEQFLTKLENFSVQDEIRRSPFGWTVVIKK
ncbi:MAG: translation initiation factor IF-3 [Candidatus Yanofskybacteria bacterium]|nr:translation initiation factor IF-3 [Candidatus Yanofskybacteria bacterium]